MSEESHIPLQGYPQRTPGDMQQRAVAFRQEMETRRSVRQFSSQPFPRAILEECLKTAIHAPSGANMQPWHFVVVSSPEVKQRIRLAAEAEERAFYDHRAPQDWLDALAPLGTGASKPFLETAPYLVAIFAQSYSFDAQGNKVKHYYTQESVGIATGFLIAALHNAGLACLTHTPSPMRFLNEILGRSANERPFLLLVVGHPAPDATVPDLKRKPFEEVVSFL